MEPHLSSRNLSSSPILFSVILTFIKRRLTLVDQIIALLLVMSRSNVRTATTTPRPTTGRPRPRTTATSTGYGYLGNDIICAISEPRGISPSVGLAFINLSTCEAVLCQFADTQTFARTCHKIKVFSPMQIIFASTAADSKLISIIHENFEVEKSEIVMTEIDRRYWSESAGYDYVKQLAFPNDFEALRLSIAGSYFAVCCFAAVCFNKVSSKEMLISLGIEVLRLSHGPDIRKSVTPHQI